MNVHPDALRASALCAVLSALLLGCPQPIAAECADGGAHDDAGLPIGTDAGNTSTDAGGQGDGGTSHDGGSSGDGGTGMDAGGEVSRADAGPFTWALLPGTGTNEIVYSVHGNSPTNVYHASDSGKLRRSSGGTFSEIYAGPGTTPPELYAVHVTPNGNVFAGGVGVLLHCLNGTCASAADFTVTPTSSLTPQYGNIEAICSQGDDVVYASGAYVSDGRLWKFDFEGNKWDVIIADTGTGSNMGCWVAPNGDVFIASGNGKIVRVDAFGVPVVELLNPVSGVDPVYIHFKDVYGTAGKVFAVGTDRRIAQRNTTTNPVSWDLVFTQGSSSSYSLYAIAGGAPDEVYAAGEPATDKKLARFNGKDWSFVTDANAPPYYLQIYDLWFATPDVVFIAGERSFDGAVVRGTR